MGQPGFSAARPWAANTDTAYETQLINTQQVQGMIQVLQGRGQLLNTQQVHAGHDVHQQKAKAEKARQAKQRRKAKAKQAEFASG